MITAYKYRLYPNPKQEVLLMEHFNGVRYIYNRILTIEKKYFEEHHKLLPENTLLKFITMWKKDEETKWLKNIYSQSLQYAASRVFKTYASLLKRGVFTGPKFKLKKDGKRSYHLSQGVIVNFNKNTVYVPKIGIVKVKFHRAFEGHIYNVTIRKNYANEYYIAFCVNNEQPAVEKKPCTIETALGIDMGLIDFCVTSRGEKVKNPKFYKKNLKKLKVLSKRLQRKQKESHNYEKARIRLAKHYNKITNTKRDFLHKLTTKLVNDNQVNVFCLETLNIKGLLKNKRLSQSIAYSGWYPFKKFLEYKSANVGKTVLFAPLFAPTSKLCTCGAKATLTLNDRIWKCPHCGAVHDRDIHAAKNIVRMAFSSNNFTRLGKSDELGEAPFENGLMNQEVDNIKLLVNN